MEIPLKDRLFEAFILHDMGAENPIMLKRIRRAWGRVNRKGKEFGWSNYEAKEPYFQWVKEEVQEIKLPFNIEILVPAYVPEPTYVLIKEDEELKITISRLEKYNEEP